LNPPHTRKKGKFGGKISKNRKKNIKICPPHMQNAPKFFAFITKIFWGLFGTRKNRQKIGF